MRHSTSIPFFLRTFAAMNQQRTYIAIDLKSFYASVECVERGLDPLTTNLVVADTSRTEKTICLAVSPALKAYGIPGRARLFEVIQRLKEVNAERCRRCMRVSGKSIYEAQLKEHMDLEVDFIAAPPRMAYYIEYSTRIYQIYLNYIAPEDIHVYSIDEVFIDATDYLANYKMTAHELALKMIRHVLKETGITATAGIGTNLYLCKVAMDIVAKHIPADKDGVRIAELDEMEYRRELWSHRPLTDFWRVGRGIAQRLEPYGIDTMGKIARCSIENEGLLYKLFGVNAELLIDHAWGWEPCTIDQIKAYKPETNSFSSGQVLSCGYDYAKTRVVVCEMADAMALNLVSKRKMTKQVVLMVDYDSENLSDPKRAATYNGPTATDHYGRLIPKPSHGSVTLEQYTSSTKQLTAAAMELFARIVNPNLLVRRINLTVNDVIDDAEAKERNQQIGQLDLFADYEALQQQKELDDAALAKERQMQETILEIKKKFGSNALLKGLNFEEGSTAKERNRQIGGHKA